MTTRRGSNSLAGGNPGRRGAIVGPEFVHSRLRKRVRSQAAAGVVIHNALRQFMIPAGYTYFGQFIDHNLTLDLTPLGRAGQLPPYLTTNHRTPWLDLDPLYGDGPDSSTRWHLYDDDRASFRLGDNNLPGGRSFDVPVNENSQPQLAEDRNNGNLIARQVHAVFLKLHHQAVQELSTRLPARERFAAARNRVHWQYQWLVRHDFLRRICHPTVHGIVINKGACLVDFQARGFSIPVEFSQAAFRFGHSMVRSQCVLNTDPPPPGAPPSLEPELGTVNLDVISGRRGNYLAAIAYPHARHQDAVVRAWR